jgi:hypothetical protein
LKGRLRWEAASRACAKGGEANGDQADRADRSDPEHHEVGLIENTGSGVSMRPTPRLSLKKPDT